MRIETEVVIKRPVKEVFAYVSDPARWTEWGSGVLECHVTETPIRKGTRLTTVTKFLGRRVETAHEVTQYQLNRRVSSRATSPFPVDMSYGFETVSGGTRLRLAVDGETRGFFRLADPLIARIFKKQTEGDLETVKEILEARVAPTAR